jgi:murein DD-endopeptidase MepM/ murein hydrolase activator NlpD
VSSYVGRHSAYAGRHRSNGRARRLPRTLRSGYALPTVAVTTLAVTATGMSIAQSAPLLSTAHLGLLGRGSMDAAALGSADAEATPAIAAAVVRDQVAEASADRMGVAQRRQDAAISHAALLGRAEERAARAKERREAAAELARARRWTLPVDGAAITSGYGWRWGRLHAGIDFGASTGTPLHAMSSGTVVFAGYESGYGYKVEIEYWDGTVSWYGHMSSISAYVGQQVSPGDTVGLVGSTGHSTGPHLHLEIHPGGGAAIDPYGWLTQHGLLA